MKSDFGLFFFYIILHSVFFSCVPLAVAMRLQMNATCSLFHFSSLFFATYLRCLSKSMRNYYLFIYLFYVNGMNRVCAVRARCTCIVYQFFTEIFLFVSLHLQIHTKWLYNFKMPPNANTPVECTGVLNENDAETNDGGLDKNIVELKGAEKRDMVFVWRNIIAFAYVHAAALYGAWLIFSSAKVYTTIFAIFLYYISGLGITAGAHRLWAHRSYKARFPLRVILAVFNTIAFQDCALHWARDHRVHHKYSETDADPHNATR